MMKDFQQSASYRGCTALLIMSYLVTKMGLIERQLRESNTIACFLRELTEGTNEYGYMYLSTNNASVRSTCLLN